MHYLLLGILAANLTVTLFDLYLQVRQLKLIDQIPVEPNELYENGQPHPEMFDKARNTAIKRTETSIIFLILNLIKVSFEMIYYYPSWIWTWATLKVQDRLWQPVLYVVAEFVFSSFIRFPISLVIFNELRRETNVNKSFKQFIAIYWGKVLLTTAFLGLFTYYTMLSLDIYGRDFFVGLWVFTSVMSVAVVPIYIKFMLPYVDEYSNLAESSLKTKLKKVADKVGFSITDIYLCQDVGEDNDQLAYFTGIFRSNVIVISVYLLTTMTEDEVVAVVTHEMGHWKLNHVWLYIICRTVHNFCLTCFVKKLYDFQMLYEAFNIPLKPMPHPAESIMLISKYVIPPIDRVLSLFGNFFKQYCEYEADRFAKEMNMASDLHSALVKMYTTKSIYPVDDILYSYTYHSHPSILNRIRRLR